MSTTASFANPSEHSANGHSIVGQRIPIIEGDKKVTGKIRFIADLQLEGMLHARFVTSPHPHARITKIDTSAAAALPGIAAILTADDMPEIPPTTRQRLLLARGRVIFAGQPVALILAENEVAAQDALELVQVDYEPLPAAITLTEAMAADAPLVWPGGKPGEDDEAAAHGADVGGDDEADAQPGNVAKRTTFERGDLAAGFAEADVIIERSFSTPMVHQSPLETHGCAVMIDSFSDEVTVWSSTQGPFVVRQQVADILGVSESTVRCIGTPVGGGFGGKGVLYDTLIALAARIVGRPIRFILTRYEEMVAANPTPPGEMRVKLGAKSDGTFTALDATYAFNSGCYPSAPLGVSLLILGSQYKVPNVAIEGLDVVSFRPSSGAYRAPGVPQSIFCLESIVEDVAKELNLNSLEVRQRNAAHPGDPMISGELWPKMGMAQVLDAVENHPLWQNREQARANGRGIGIAIGGWPGGTGPASAACNLDRDGTLNIELGSVDISGVNTGFMMLAAETFGVAPEKIRISNGDTRGSAFALNAGGSKITYTVGPALIKAVADAKQQTLEIVSDLLEVATEDLEIVDGKVQVKGSPETAIDLGEVAGKTMQFGGQYAPVLGSGSTTVIDRSPGFCAQIAEIEVDERTGDVQIHKLVVIQDVGKALNPLTVEGQMMGGAVQGMGWALFEELKYDDYGQPVTASWMDYNLPHMNQIAGEIETVIVEVPSDYGPMGAKGVGEPSIIPTAAAIGNAIAHVTGKRLTDLPMTAPRVLAALQ